MISLNTSVMVIIGSSFQRNFARSGVGLGGISISPALATLSIVAPMNFPMAWMPLLMGASLGSFVLWVVFLIGLGGTGISRALISSSSSSRGPSCLLVDEDPWIR